MRPSLGAALSVAARPSVCLSVRPSRAFDLAEIGRPYRNFIFDGVITLKTSRLTVRANFKNLN